MKAYKIKLLILYIFLHFQPSTFAQGGGPPPPGLPGDGTPTIAIDRYAKQLLVAGLILGLIVIVSRRRL
ncbi:hypothetical protein FLCH110379_22780 [Flavobacterium chungbukense]